MDNLAFGDHNLALCHDILAQTPNNLALPLDLLAVDRHLLALTYFSPLIRLAIAIEFRMDNLAFGDHNLALCHDILA